MKVFVFMPNYIGDILMTTPAIRLLKQNLQESSIILIIKERYKELLDKNPNIDNIIFRDNKFQLLKKILHVKPDVCLLFRTTFFNSFSAFLSRAKYTVGLNNEFSRIFVKSIIHEDENLPYRYQSYLVVKRLFVELNKHYINENNIDIMKIDFYGYNENIVADKVKSLLQEKRIDLRKKIIVISPASTRATKMMPAFRYRKLIRMIYDSFRGKVNVIFVGSSKDIDLVNRIIDGTDSLSLCGLLSLKELGYLLSISKVLIAPDSGPAYIAQAVGCPTIIYFTSTLPNKYGPFNEHTYVIYDKKYCSPCYKDYCKKIDMCTNQVNLDKIFESVIRIIK